MHITADDLRALGPRGKREYIDALANAEPSVLPTYGIDTPLRIAHFWAQAAHECDGFKTMNEYWGPTKAQKGYEGRKNLGNTQPGDGYRFRGRGIFQCTGRDNYARIGKKLGLNLVDNPDRAADPVIALRIACEYWKSRSLNALADKNDILAITKKINGGTNGLPERRAAFTTAWKLWGGQTDDGEAAPPPPPAKTIATSKTAGAAVGTGAAGGTGIAIAYEAGKEAVERASDIKDAATSASYVFGIDGTMAIVIGCAIILAAGVAFIVWDRWRKLKTEGV